MGKKTGGALTIQEYREENPPLQENDDVSAVLAYLNSLSRDSNGNLNVLDVINGITAAQGDGWISRAECRTLAEFVSEILTGDQSSWPAHVQQFYNHRNSWNSLHGTPVWDTVVDDDDDD